MDNETTRSVYEITFGAITVIGMVANWIRSSKINQNTRLSNTQKETVDIIEQLSKDLLAHKLQDATDISTLKANVINLNKESDKMDKKLDTILEITRTRNNNDNER
jgi:hypothetical protein